MKPIRGAVSTEMSTAMRAERTQSGVRLSLQSMVDGRGHRRAEFEIPVDERSQPIGPFNEMYHVSDLRQMRDADFRGPSGLRVQCGAVMRRFGAGVGGPLGAWTRLSLADPRSADPFVMELDVRDLKSMCALVTKAADNRSRGAEQMTATMRISTEFVVAPCPQGTVLKIPGSTGPDCAVLTMITLAGGTRYSATAYSPSPPSVGLCLSRRNLRDLGKVGIHTPGVGLSTPERSRTAGPVLRVQDLQSRPVRHSGVAAGLPLTGFSRVSLVSPHEDVYAEAYVPHGTVEDLVNVLLSVPSAYGFQSS